MKRTLRFGLLLLAMMLLASTAVWAGGGASLKGKTVEIGNFWENWDVKTFKPTNESQEKMLDWRIKIQKDNGVTITEKMVSDWGGMLEAITTSVMAGRPAAQAFHVTPDWAMALHRQSLLAPVSDSKVVDWTNTKLEVQKKPVYNQEVKNIFTFGGKSYAFTFGYGGSRHSRGIYFNKRLFREAGLSPDLPYDMQKAGTWTWDAFADLCKQLTRDRNNTGRINVYAITEDTSDAFLEAFAFSNGGMYVDKDAQGRLVNATARPEFIEAMQYCRRLRDSGVMMPRPEGSNWDWFFSAFMEGQAAMMIEAEWRCDALSQTMTDDWGYVVPPKGPRAKDYRFAQDENVIVIPSTYKAGELDTIVAAVNLWYMPLEDNWQAGLLNSYRDRRAVDETLAMVRSPGRGVFRMEMLVPGLQVGDIAWQMWWFDGEPAQLVESVSQNWNSMIADANK